MLRLYLLLLVVLGIVHRPKPNTENQFVVQQFIIYHLHIRLKPTLIPTSNLLLLDLQLIALIDTLMPDLRVILRIRIVRLNMIRDDRSGSSYTT